MQGNLKGKEVSIFQSFAPYLSHNPATFWHTKVVNRRIASGGFAGDGMGTGYQAIALTLRDEQHRRDLQRHLGS